MKLRYYHNLDGLRGIAALMVVVFHFFIFPNTEYVKNIDVFQRFTEFGQHGVSLFFVLSGFVITRILINTREQKNYFRNFYWRRVLRILPLYYTFLIIFYICMPLLDRNDTPFRMQLPYYFYIQNFQDVFKFAASGPEHYWSLSVEEHFYMLWPLAVYLFKPKHLSKVIGISILGVFVLKYFMLKEGLPIHYFTFTRIDQILMGAYLAVLELEGYFSKKNSARNMLLISILIFPGAIAIYFLSGSFPFFKEMTKYLFLGIFFFGIIGFVIASKERNIINRFLSGKVLQYLGRISYGIYVWHVLALIILKKFLIVEIVAVDLLLSIALTIVLAHISYYYYETYFLKLKDKKITLRRKISNS